MEIPGGPWILATIWLSLTAYFVAAAIWAARPAARLCRTAATVAWTFGAAALLCHLAVAFHFAHGWSHAHAWETTARRTEELMNWRFGDGIYVSYVFAALWAGDAAWAWAFPGRWQSRPKWLEGAWQAFVAFMVVNGGFVFAAGPIRAYTLAGFAAVAGATLIGAWRRSFDVAPT